METEDVLTGNRHIPLYHAKKNELKPEGIHIIFHLKRPLSENIVPIVVDNVLDTGHTAMAAVKALSSSDAILAVLCNTERYKDNKEANFVQVDNGLSQKTKGKKKSKAKKSVSTVKKKTIKEASRTENKKCCFREEVHRQCHKVKISPDGYRQWREGHPCPCF